jgi:hypothetical protein
MVADMREGSRDIFSQGLDCVLVAILVSVSFGMTPKVFDVLTQWNFGQRSIGASCQDKQLFAETLGLLQLIHD